MKLLALVAIFFLFLGTYQIGRAMGFDAGVREVNRIVFLADEREIREVNYKSLEIARYKCATPFMVQWCSMSSTTVCY